MEVNPIIKLEDLFDYSHLGIKVNKEYAEKIRKEIRSKFGSFKKAAQLTGVNHVTISKIERRCTRLYIWKKILNFLKIPLNDLESQTVEVADKYIYHIKFPYVVSPLLVRLVAHIIGDGGYYIYNARWTQKDVKPILDLQKEILGIAGAKINSTNTEQASIMNFYVKLVCAVLKIKREQVNSADFIKSCIMLPRAHRVQVIAAIIEDESRIQSESGSIQIAMKDNEIIKALAKLMDNLGYDRSDIKIVKNKGFFKSKNKDSESILYAVFMRILGAHKFYQDLKASSNKYGLLAKLWKKQSSFEKLISLNDGKKAIGENINRILSRKALELMKNKNGCITYKELKNFLNISHHRTGSIIRRLFNKKYIKRINRGYYSLVQS